MRDEYLFISDCHLDPDRPAVGGALLEFLSRRTANAARLYILGDLFEVWLGDDDPALEHRAVIDALKGLAKDCEIFFLAGNRDFLVGREFAAQVGMSVLLEPELIRLGDNRVALIHGDTLCTDDHDYQAFRSKVRAPAWQTEFLAKPLAERQQIAAQLRRDSTDAMRDKSAEIMDVNSDSVMQCFRELGVDTIIHGHTHRPGVHQYAGELTRYVLGDWNPGPSFLRWTANDGFELRDPRI